MFSYLFLVLGRDAAFWLLRFFHFFLIEAPHYFWKMALAVSAAFEAYWATWINFRHLFTPLYQDDTWVGRLLGPFFRLLRVVIGIGVHLLLLALYIILFFFFCVIFWGAPFLFVINLFIWNQ